MTHCMICDKSIPHANIATRTRRICGDCLRSIMKLINSVPMRVYYAKK